MGARLEHYEQRLQSRTAASALQRQQQQQEQQQQESLQARMLQAARETSQETMAEGLQGLREMRDTLTQLVEQRDAQLQQMRADCSAFLVEMRLLLRALKDSAAPPSPPAAAAPAPLHDDDAALQRALERHENRLVERIRQLLDAPPDDHGTAQSLPSAPVEPPPAPASQSATQVSDGSFSSSPASEK